MDLLEKKKKINSRAGIKAKLLRKLKEKATNNKEEAPIKKKMKTKAKDNPNSDRRLEKLEKFKNEKMEQTEIQLKTNQDFEKEILRKPNDSEIWIQYISFVYEKEVKIV